MGRETREPFVVLGRSMGLIINGKGRDGMRLGIDLGDTSIKIGAAALYRQERL